MKELASPKRLIIFILFIIASASIILHLYFPTPPKKIIIATGGEKGAYYAMGQEIKRRLADSGITVEVRKTQGSVENLELLNDPTSGVDIAIVQSGISNAKERPNLESLTGLFYEPVWVAFQPKAFPKGTPSSIAEIKDKRIGIALVGSGTRKITDQIFELNGVSTKSPNFFAADPESLFNKLQAHELDVAIFVYKAEAPFIGKVFKDHDIKFMSFGEAYGYLQAMPSLTVINIPRSVLDIPTDTPEKEIRVISPVAELVINERFHPAITTLLMNEMNDVINDPTIVAVENTFPNVNHLSFKVNEDAEEYVKNGLSIVDQYLPFWVAVWFDRLIRVVLPLLAVLLPLYNFLPGVFEYFEKQKKARIYIELRHLEKELSENGEKDFIITRLNLIENKVIQSKFEAEEIFDMRSHIDLVREKLTGQLPLAKTEL
ncbi:TAXI family TRAP transporter solute-binding subunit [Polynucleobacter kasalickyi]|uniref:TRAP-type uncharacterized transport system, substrate-binding protein n=1 Tax=Polynucleobacter kasalickyi TaxID=1938817 RepID=A0A1W1Y3N5_9BURK|nr:TAXI family TRAP transporter solute-binding subunit [Polynucleobacter kasalickyi]SMC30755.1 TRAP-type uncharacterized transport system, substrate-binding protein [Polynucleobacter kasalickyi]